MFYWLLKYDDDDENLHTIESMLQKMIKRSKYIGKTLVNRKIEKNKMLLEQHAKKNFEKKIFILMIDFDKALERWNDLSKTYSKKEKLVIMNAPRKHDYRDLVKISDINVYTKAHDEWFIKEYGKYLINHKRHLTLEMPIKN